MPRPNSSRCEAKARPKFRRNERERHPPSLRGRDIGLFYRDRAKQQQKKAFEIKLSIPTSVLHKISNDLKDLTYLAEKNQMCIPTFDKISTMVVKNDIPVDNKYDIMVIEKEPLDVKTSFMPTSTIEMLNKPSTSAPLDFIPCKQETNQIYGTYDRQMSLREVGDYKYSYQDIITGTFQEKLEEKIAKGVSINELNTKINDISVAVNIEYNDMIKRNEYKKMLKFRETLPTYKKRKELLEIISNNQVVVISGETGCGKSTQVPQIILDDAIINNRGGNVKIVVTQPRRIAASSLAMRVAHERAEEIGNSVGYAVRLERVAARPVSSITFCTTGILLTELEVNQGLVDCSHIILDEVHERDNNIDLAMCMLKQVLRKRKDLKLILMSATIDAERLSEYFDNCPMMHIEGLAYPVQDVYLEDILKLTQFKLPEETFRETKGSFRHGHGNYQRNSKILQASVKYRAEIQNWLQSIKKEIDRDIYQTLNDYRIEELNISLILELLKYICKGPPGAILVFLPGFGDITKLLNAMTECYAFPSHKYEIYPLHSKLPSLDQHKIFEKPKDGVRKIIVATNIAETSITIDDIVYVVDSGWMKITGLNVEQNISTLNVEWISQANLRQRRGRAGRCQPGVCYHLLTSYRAQTLAERVLPELQRSDLLEPVLAIKQLRLGKAEEALNLVPDPPAKTTVERAVKHLQQCGALNEEETLTPLGWHLARLPVHPAAGKLLLLGALFGCLDRAASVAAVWGFKDPFMLVIGKESEVDEAKRKFTQGEPSDHVAMSEAIIEWERCDRHEKRSFAYSYFLSNNTLSLLSDMKSQFGDSLKRMGFLASGDVKASWENRNASNLSLFKAIVAASLYPNIATVRWAGIKYSKPNKVPTISANTPEEGRVKIHPSSVMAPPKHDGRKKGYIQRNSNFLTSPGANWLVYWRKQRSTNLFLIDVTLVYTLPLLFFGELKITDADEERPGDCFISISKIKVRCKKETADILINLRSLLDQVLASKVMASSDYSTKHNEFEERVLNTVIDLITAEDECAEYLGDDGSDSSDYESSQKQWCR